MGDVETVGDDEATEAGGRSKCNGVWWGEMVDVIDESTGRATQRVQKVLGDW